VLESLEKLEDDRRCWRLVNGVLFEKSKLEVVPELHQMINNLTAVVKQLNDALLLKK
jgi:chaperonin cofactor prefoldin